MQTTLKNLVTKNLVLIPAGSPLSETWDLMAEKRFRHLPVVNSDQEIIGIISQRDLVHRKKSELIPVEEAMSSPVYFIDQHAPLRSAIFKLIEHKISSLLIVDQNKLVIGIITTDDLLWYLSSLLEDAKGKRFLFSSLFDLQTVGEIAQQVSNMGI